MWKRIKKFWYFTLGVITLPITTLVALGKLFASWYKNSKRLVRILLLSLVGAFVALIATAFIVDYIDDIQRQRRLEQSHGTEYISQVLERHIFYNKPSKMYNHKTQSYVIDTLDHIFQYQLSDTIVIYTDIRRHDYNSKRGFLNIKSGEVIVPAREYRKAWHFSEGLAAVVKEDKVGFINTQGEVVIPFIFDYAESTEYLWDFGYMFYNGYSIMTDSSRKFGIINKAGQWVVEPQYDRITGIDEYGFRKVELDGKYGLMKSDGTLVYNVEYDEVTVYDGDNIVLAKNGRKWKENSRGQVTAKNLFDSTTPLIIYVLNPDDDYDTILTPYVAYQVCDRYGVMDSQTGEILCPALFTDIEIVGKELFEVSSDEADIPYSLYLTSNDLRKIR